MGVIGNLSLLIGSILYNKYFTKLEFRYVLGIANYISIVGGLLGVAFIMDLNSYIGMSDVVFYGIQSVFAEALIMAFVDLPSMVLFAKVTPKHIEGTVFAILTGTINFSGGVLSPTIGSLINDLFIKVTTKNITVKNMSILGWIETFCAIFPIFFMHLIPMRKQIEKLQKKYEEQESKIKEELEAINSE